MARTTWSRPYLVAELADGSRTDVIAGEVPADTRRVELRWRHPGAKNARKATVTGSDPAGVARLLALAERIGHARHDPASFEADHHGYPVPVASHGTSRPVAAPLPEVTATVSGLLVSQPIPAAALAPASSTVLAATTVLNPMDRLRAYPGNPMLGAVAAGVFPAGWTMAELIPHYWTHKLAAGGSQAKNLTDIESHLTYIARFFSYDHGLVGDTDEVIDWKLARMQAVGAQVGDPMHVSLMLPQDFFEFLAYRRIYDARIARLNGQAVLRYDRDVQAWDAGGRLGSAPTPPRLRPQVPVSDRTVEATMKTLGALMAHAVSLGLFLGPDPWAAFKASGSGGRSPIPRPRRTRVDERTVPPVATCLDLAATVGVCGPVRGGAPLGARYRFAVELASIAGLRPSELWAMPPDALRKDPDGYYVVRVCTSLTRVVKAHSPNDSDTVTSDRLKMRQPGEVRDVPVPRWLVPRWEAHRAAYASDTHLFTSQQGQAVRWGNDVDEVWHPAVQQCLGDTPHARLDFSTLRKVAITWWLESGMSHRRAAELAGHSVEVQLEHYAGVAIGGAENRRWTGIDDALAAACPGLT